MLIYPGLRWLRSSKIQQLLNSAAFFAPNTHSLNLTLGTGSQTITRATTHTVQNNDGYLVTCLAGEIPIKGGRRIWNFVPSSESSTGWSLQGSTVSASAISLPTGYTNGFKLTEDNSNGVHEAYVLSSGPPIGATAVVQFVAKAAERSLAVFSDASGSKYRCVNLADGTSGTNVGTTNFVSENLGDGWYWFSWRYVVSAQNMFFFVGSADNTVSYQGVAGNGIYYTGLQVENVTAQTNQAAGEYVSVGVLSSPWHGAGVDGVEWKTNDISGNPIATATLDGAEVWPAGTQILATADIRDMTTANWVLGATMTRARTSVGYDGAANSATRLTGGAVAATNTCYLTVTAAASSRTYSAMVKRVTGTGPVRIVQTGTETDISAQLSTTGYALVELNASVLNVAIGFKIDTNGDAIDVDFNQFESGAYATSRMAATGAARNASVISVPTASNIASAAGFIALEYTPQHAPSGTVYLWGTYVDANNSTAILHDATNLIFRKRIAGVNYDATIANTFVSGTTYKMAASWGSGGTNIALGGTLGTPNTTGITGSPYIKLPGSGYVSAPDSADQRPTGNVTLIAKVGAADYTPTSANVIYIDGDNVSDAWHSLYVYIDTTGVVVVSRPTASGTARSYTSTAGLSSVVSDNADVYLKCAWEQNVGGVSRCTFSYSTDGVSYTQLGNVVTHADVTAARNINGGGPRIGQAPSYGGFPFNGRIYSVKLLDATNTAVIDCNPADYTSGGTTWTSSTTGEVYTVNGTASMWPFVRIASTMQTGADGNGANQPGMAIKNVYVGNRALSNAELQAISLR